MSASPFVTDRSWVFPVAPDELWATLARTQDYRRWWPWLVRCDVDGLVPGAEARCVVRPPLPYTLRFTVVVQEVEAPRLVAGVVEGDLNGPARLEIGEHRDGAEARLAWRVEVNRPWVRVAGRVGRPLLAWGHDRVVESGVAQFRRRALGHG